MSVAAKRVLRDFGPSVFLKGLGPAAVREGLFSAAYLGMVPLMEEKLKEQEARNTLNLTLNPKGPVP